MYATSSDRGKKTRLKRKKRKKLCPFRAATRAGQNAISTQTIANRMYQSIHYLHVEGGIPSVQCSGLPPLVRRDGRLRRGYCSPCSSSAIAISIASALTMLPVADATRAVP